MNIREETPRVLLNLTNIKAESSIYSILNQSSPERSDQASLAESFAEWVGDINQNRVGKGETRRAVCVDYGFVNVSGGIGKRLVLAPEAGDSNLIANGVC